MQEPQHCIKTDMLIQDIIPALREGTGMKLENQKFVAGYIVSSEPLWSK